MRESVVWMAGWYSVKKGTNVIHPAVIAQDYSPFWMFPCATPFLSVSYRCRTIDPNPHVALITSLVTSFSFFFFSFPFCFFDSFFLPVPPSFFFSFVCCLLRDDTLRRLFVCSNVDEFRIVPVDAPCAPSFDATPERLLASAGDDALLFNVFALSRFYQPRPPHADGLRFRSPDGNVTISVLSRRLDFLMSPVTVFLFSFMWLPV